MLSAKVAGPGAVPLLLEELWQAVGSKLTAKRPKVREGLSIRPANDLV